MNCTIQINLRCLVFLNLPINFLNESITAAIRLTLNSGLTDSINNDFIQYGWPDSRSLLLCLLCWPAALAYRERANINIFSSAHAFSATATQSLRCEKNSCLQNPNQKSSVCLNILSEVWRIRGHTSRLQADAASAGWSKSSSPEESPCRRNRVTDDLGGKKWCSTLIAQYMLWGLKGPSVLTYQGAGLSKTKCKCNY